MRDVRSQMVAGLGAVEEKVEEVERRVMEDMRASQMRDLAEMEEMEEMRDQMRVMCEQLSLLPSQLRLLGRQCDEVKGQLGCSISGQGMTRQGLEEIDGSRAAGHEAAAGGGG